MIRKLRVARHSKRAQPLRNMVNQKARPFILYIGADWVDQKHDAVTIDEGGQKLGTIRIARLLKGLVMLEIWLVSLSEKQSKERKASSAVFPKPVPAESSISCKVLP